MSNPNDYSHNWIWIKNKVTKFLSVKTQPLSKTEDILVFYQQYDDTFTDWRRKYFNKLLEYIGKSKKQIVDEFLNNHPEDDEEIIKEKVLKESFRVRS
jgi:hypothetical protein